jgi:tRNA(Ile)-lysidine synthase TilS/MesJ
MKIIVSFSGGKDSHACLIEAVKKYGADKIEAVFCDTGWERFRYA